MKNFDLEEYLRLKEEGKEPKIVTRDGRDVRILCTDKKNSKCIIALISITDDTEITMHYYNDGYEKDATEISKYDLFFAPTKRKGWVNIYKNYNNTWLGRVHDTKEDAQNYGMGGDFYVATIAIEWEE